MEQETVLNGAIDSPPAAGPTLSDRIARLHRELTESFETLLRQRAEFEGARARLGEWEDGLSDLRVRTETARNSFEKGEEPVQPPPMPIREPTAYNLPEVETKIETATALGTEPIVEAPKAIATDRSGRRYIPSNFPAYMALLAGAVLTGPFEFSSRPAEPPAPKVMGDTTKAVSPTQAPERFPALPPSALEDERGREALGLVYSWVPDGGPHAVLELLADAGGSAWDDPDVERLDRDIYQVTLPRPIDRTRSSEGGWTFQVNVASGLVLPSPLTSRLLALALGR